MIIDKRGKLFENRRKKNVEVEKDRRKENGQERSGVSKKNTKNK